MNKLNKLLFISQSLLPIICIINCFLIGNKPANAHLKEYSKKESTSINFVSQNNTLSSKNNSSSNDIIGKIIVSLLTGGVIGQIQQQRIEQKKDVIQQLEKDLEDKANKIENFFKEKYNSEEYPKQHMIDFFALINEDYGLNKIDIQGVMAEDVKENKLEEYNENFKYSIKAINGLLYSDESDKKLLKGLVNSVISQTVTYDNKEDFKNKCRELYSYLRGWLICSMRYNTEKLPIESIQYNALSKDEKIKALEYTKKIVLNDEKIKEKIPNHLSRKLICEYIDILLEKILSQ
ncbi:hypothetical protein Riv7116_3950 [Rivularia sp. PCC 7116]|nr:hypothetical protein Riv7116_3950 [Rivularia sp. PCC 7116]